MAFRRFSALFGVALAAIMIGALTGSAASIDISLQYAGSLNSAFESIGSPLNDSPQHSLPSDYHQFDVFMKIDGALAAEAFQAVQFDIKLAPGMVPADFGAWVAEAATYDPPGPQGPTGLFSTNADSGANPNDLERIVIIAANATGANLVRPGESGPFKIGSAYLQWDGSTTSSVDVAPNGLDAWGLYVNSAPTAQFAGFVEDPGPEFSVTGTPTNLPPEVGDKAVDWFSQFPPVANSDSLPLTDDGPVGVWSIESFTAPNGIAPSIDPVSGVFSWIGNGSPQGVYPAVLKYTDGGGLSDTGTLSITWNIPEPSTVALFGLALVGLAGCRRK